MAIVPKPSWHVLASFINRSSFIIKECSYSWKPSLSHFRRFQSSVTLLISFPHFSPPDCRNNFFSLSYWGSDWRAVYLCCSLSFDLFLVASSSDVFTGTDVNTPSPLWVVSACLCISHGVLLECQIFAWLWAVLAASLDPERLKEKWSTAALFLIWRNNQQKITDPSIWYPWSQISTDKRRYLLYQLWDQLLITFT